MRKKGWIYERKGHEKFIEQFGPLRYIPSQWFMYAELGKGPYKFCQTDGLLFTPEEKKVLIIEFKLKHTSDAYFQVEEKYVPVLRRLFPKWIISTCEVVKWYDSATPFPTEVRLKRKPEETLPGEFGVHILDL